MFKIATFAEWFGLGMIEGIKESARCGASGVQLSAWNQLNPYEITPEGIAEIKRVAEGCGQTITALCGELSEVSREGGLENAAKNGPKVEYLKRVFDLAAKLNCNVVTTHIGVIPEDKSSARYAALHEACDELGQYAAAMNGWLAIETGPEPVSRLCEFADSFGSGRVAVNYDPANLIMVTGDDEVQGVITAGKRIVHTHAKDGIMKKYVGPETIYEIFATGGVEALASLSDYFAEMPLGEGSVRWIEYLNALRDVGYNGYLTIEREVSANAAADIGLAVDFLKKLLKNY